MSTVTDTLTSAEAKVIATQIGHLTQELSKQGRALESIDAGLRTLIKVEFEQQSLQSRIAELQKANGDMASRLVKVETEMPQLLETRKWIVGALIAMVGLLGVTVLKVTVFDHSRPAAASPANP